MANLVVNGISEEKGNQIAKVWGSMRRFGLFSVYFIPAIRQEVIKEIVKDAKKKGLMGNIIKLVKSFKDDLHNSVIDTNMCSLELRSHGLEKEVSDYFFKMKICERVFLYEECRLYWENGKGVEVDSDIIKYFEKI